MKMKWCMTGFLLPVLCAGVQLRAQSVQTLVCFNGTNGSYPISALTLGNDGNFYGTADNGGSNNEGTVFMVTTSGTLTTLVSFAGTNGVDPAGGLTLGKDGDFYGTTYEGGGNNDGGTVFNLTTNGTLTTLAFFDATNGLYPVSALTLGNDGNFYGTTTQFGNTNLNGGGGFGAVFQVMTNGALNTLATFNGTNGASPQAGLTLASDGNLYGTTVSGGSGGEIGGAYGTVFKVTTNGILTTLVSFPGTNAGVNGTVPVGGLTLGNDGNLYGTTSSGGSNNDGTVFMMTTNGALTTLIYFDGTNGANPETALTLGNDGNFYGTTSSGGNTNFVFPNGMGTLFKVTTNGILTTLIAFNGANGSHPVGALTLGNDGNFYGTTQWGGNTNLNGGSGYGTVFRLSLLPVIPPTLTLQFWEGYPLLSMFGTLGDTYTVEYTTNLAVPNWTPMLIVPNLSISPFQMIDPAGVGQPMRFYRAVQSQ
ncbi:MAG: choice-of-anchor tandem repeat GloVer-containing protein [Verrucomicrobiia bacterium]